MPSTAHHAKKKLVLLSGLSGAGKRTASKAFEDSGYHCIDNLPIFLLTPLLKNNRQDRDLLLVMDAREPDFLANFQAIAKKLHASPFEVSILFLDAEDSVLIRRFSEMRRLHPMKHASVKEGIHLERAQLAKIKAQADIIIDTSHLTPHLLRSHLLKHISSPKTPGMQISLISFGFKHRLPEEIDLLFDVRFLPNPYFIPELKMYSGLEPSVMDYVLSSDITRQFIAHISPLLHFLLPNYRKEGKAYLGIGIGCTGGRHRSVAIAEKVKTILLESGEDVAITHRDIDAGKHG